MHPWNGGTIRSDHGHLNMVYNGKGRHEYYMDNLDEQFLPNRPNLCSREHSCLYLVASLHKAMPGQIICVGMERTDRRRLKSYAFLS